MHGVAHNKTVNASTESFLEHNDELSVSINERLPVQLLNCHILKKLDMPIVFRGNFFEIV